MATRADIRTQIQRELRDPNGNSWSDDELNDLINSGINAVSDLSPREIREDITYTFPYTIAQGAFGKIKEVTPVNSFFNIFRVEILDNNSALKETLPASVSEGSSTGWEWFNGKVLLPENYWYPSTTVVVAGNPTEQIKVRIYGYGRHPFLTNDVTATTLTDQEQQAVRVYAVAEALSRLMTDRANFQQWQIASGSNDITISELAVLANAARQRWFGERGRLRKMRRLG
jgi:hypothetical protein